MNLGGLHHTHGKGIHKHRIMDSYRLPTCHDHRWNTWKGYLGVVFCADDEACHVVNKGRTSPLISSFSCNKLLTGFVWILPRVNIDNSGRIQSFKRLIGYLLGCQQRRLAFIHLLRFNIDLPMVRLYGLLRRGSELSCCDLFSNCWCEGIFWWPPAHCSSAWSPNRLVVGFWNVISTIIVIFGYRAEIVIEIVIVDR